MHFILFLIPYHVIILNTLSFLSSKKKIRCVCFLFLTSKVENRGFSGKMVVGDQKTNTKLQVGCTVYSSSNLHIQPTSYSKGFILKTTMRTPLVSWLFCPTPAAFKISHMRIIGYLEVLGGCTNSEGKEPMLQTFSSKDPSTCSIRLNYQMRYGCPPDSWQNNRDASEKYFRQTCFPPKPTKTRVY